MPNRTIYLPDELDVLSRRLGLNLSRLTQRAIAEHLEERSDDVVEVRADATTDRLRDLGLAWPERSLEHDRDAAGER